MITRALSFTGPGSVEMCERELPELRPDEVLVAVRAVGVCFGDVSHFRSESGPFPSWAGHEAAGIIESVGAAVTSVAPGDTVALLGQEKFAEMAIANERDVARFRSPVEDWALWVAEPLACCVSAVHLAGIVPDDNVAVVGCGFMGLGIIQALSLSLAREIVAIAPRQFSLDRATEFGATATYLAHDPNLIQSASAGIEPRPMPQQYLGPNIDAGPFDLVFETSGTKAGMDTASALTRTGGTLVLFGHLEGDVLIPGTQWHMKGLRVLNASPMSSPDFQQEFYRTVALLDRGKLTLKGLVTHRADMEDANRLLEESSAADYIKGVLLVEPGDRSNQTR